MTTHKDRPHATNCRACLFPISGGGFTEAPCNCAEGTRWHGNGARIEDAIAIQGIATFFARLQVAEFYYHPIDFDIYPNNGGIETLLSPLYAAPVAPAAQTRPCKICGGEGQYFDGPTEDPVAVQCDACEGTGRVPEATAPAAQVVPVEWWKAMNIAIACINADELPHGWDFDRLKSVRSAMLAAAQQQKKEV